jgi:hypothetical protein
MCTLTELNSSMTLFVKMWSMNLYWSISSVPCHPRCFEHSNYFLLHFKHAKAEDAKYVQQSGDSASLSIYIYPRHGPHRKTASNNSSTIASVSVAGETCSPRRCLSTDHVLMSQYKCIKLRNDGVIIVKSIVYDFICCTGDLTTYLK